MAARLPTELDMVAKKKTPGPGTYKLDITEMKGAGSYILSNYPNYISPKYLSPTNRSRSRSPERNSSTIGPGQCTFTSHLDDFVNHEKFGQSLISKFKNSVTSSFSKE